MKITNRLLLAACLVLPLAACKKEEAAPVEVAQAALVAPDKSDEAGWKAYLSDVVLRNMGEISIEWLRSSFMLPTRPIGSLRMWVVGVAPCGRHH